MPSSALVLPGRSVILNCMIQHAPADARKIPHCVATTASTRPAFMGVTGATGSSNATAIKVSPMCPFLLGFTFRVMHGDVWMDSNMWKAKRYHVDRVNGVPGLVLGTRRLDLVIAGGQRLTDKYSLLKVLSLGYACLVSSDRQNRRIDSAARQRNVRNQALPHWRDTALLLSGKFLERHGNRGRHTCSIQRCLRRHAIGVG